MFCFRKGQISLEDSIFLEINFNNKAQFKQLMSHLRVRPIEKPIIIHSLTYNHRPELSQNSSQASFLKLSQKNSQELVALSGSNLFEEMQERLNRMEAKSIRKIHEIQTKIIAHDQTNGKENNYSRKVMVEKVEAQLTYRLQPGLEDDLEDCNFEMDENRNYVRDSSQENSSNLVRQLIEAKEILSEPHWQPPLTLRNHIQPNSKTQSRRSSFCNRSQVSPAHQARPCLGRSITSKKRGGSSCKSSKAVPTGVYQQILSNYTTAKLLAMQKATSDR